MWLSHGVVLLTAVSVEAKERLFRRKVTVMSEEKLSEMDQFVDMVFEGDVISPAPAEI